MYVLIIPYKNTQLNVPAPQFMSEMFLNPGAVPEQDRHIFRTQKTMDKKEILNSTLHELVTPKSLSEEQIEYVKKLELSMTEIKVSEDAIFYCRLRSLNFCYAI